MRFGAFYSPILIFLVAYQIPGLRNGPRHVCTRIFGETGEDFAGRQVGGQGGTFGGPLQLIEGFEGWSRFGNVGCWFYLHVRDWDGKGSRTRGFRPRSRSHSCAPGSSLESTSQPRDRRRPRAGAGPSTSRSPRPPFLHSVALLGLPAHAAIEDLSVCSRDSTCSLFVFACVVACCRGFEPPLFQECPYRRRAAEMDGDAFNGNSLVGTEKPSVKTKEERR
jgi:hypothetical protein